MTRARQHPTGLSVLAASTLVDLAHRAGIAITLEEGLVVVALVGSVVSKLSPRNV